MLHGATLQPPLLSVHQTAAWHTCIASDSVALHFSSARYTNSWSSSIAKHLQGRRMQPD